MESMALVPATPLACIELVKRAGVDIKGKRVTVVGRGDTVGRPLAMLLLSKGRDATVTVCHSRTADLAGACREADILFAAAGAGANHLIKKDMVKPGAIIIDAAINQKPDGSITGDVDPAAAEVACVITPVPGGVGSLTTTIICGNTLKAMKLQKGLNSCQDSCPALSIGAVPEGFGPLKIHCTADQASEGGNPCPSMKRP